jgi:hypothetical protein
MYAIEEFQMEALTRLVTDSLTRHGFDRPIDPHRLQWSRWFRCDSSRSLLVVPSKPGIFAIAEEIASGVARALSPATFSPDVARPPSPATVSSEAALGSAALGAAPLQRCVPALNQNAASAAEPKRMLAVLQFCEDDDMAFTLDCMFTRVNPMRSRLSSGSSFLRFVVIEDQDQRRNICSALNQWLASSAAKATGLPPAFSSSMELNVADARDLASTTGLDSGFNTNLHCSQPIPSGF